MLKKMKLAMKIGAGFGVVILLLVIISVVAWEGLSSVKEGFVTYRGLARHTNLAGRLQANMLMVRMNVKDFNATGSAKDIQQYEEYVKKMDGFIEEAHKEINKPERAEKIDIVTDKMHEYEKAFERVKEIRVERDMIVGERLRGYGPSMEKSLTEIMKTAKEDGDAAAAYEAGIVLRHMLLGRLYGQTYLSTNAPADFDRVKTEFSGVFKGVGILDEMLQNPTRRALNDKVKEEATIYIAAFTELDTIIQERNDIIANTLDKIGPQVAAAVEEVKLSVKAEQDELGPILQAKSQNAIRLITMAAVIATVIAIIAALFITRTITAPVQRVVDFVDKLASGDFTMKLDIDQEDEIGNMSRALSQTVIELGTMIKEIINGVNTLSSSSTELSAISTQLAGNAKEGSLKATGVAAAAEEMSTNMSSVSAAMEQSSSNVGMVATAAEEMSATVNEIAQNAARAKGISEEAVVQSQNTSIKINDLGQAASKIGKVTETITDISEQTNLLALNATIEAARAGEAGKGFAVVANEIKDLAKQTAEATVDIKNQIEGMQTTTDGTITDIEKIGEVINEINEVITTIATAVEEQSAATAEISNNVAQASAGIGEVNENVAQSSVAIEDVTRDISEISSTSDEINSASNNVNDSATELSQLAEQLDNLVKRFKIA
ncbi:methyl-accepting chemotaxis protein [Desulfopila sp. IMCC35008]|uniref:methyl-accepting chemotaxis protein n=1 Tax=Desulfopila sp. IMCC35008 TaxID=2653858 RepID=UPI0013D70C0B|nr:HAMP domain-containing methyl-accepting chemotaxis protein [Desulfopila sp. IMCC35008]